MNKVDIESDKIFHAINILKSRKIHKILPIVELKFFANYYAKCKLFERISDLTEEERIKLCSLFKYQYSTKGEIVYNYDSIANLYYLIIQGTVEIFKPVKHVISIDKNEDSINDNEEKKTQRFEKCKKLEKQEEVFESFQLSSKNEFGENSLDNNTCIR